MQHIHSMTMLLLARCMLICLLIKASKISYNNNNKIEAGKDRRSGMGKEEVSFLGIGF